MTAPITLIAEQKGLRLDRWLADEIDEYSRSRLKALIEGENLTCNGEVMSNPAHKTILGAEYVLTVPAPVAADPTPEDIPLDVVFEDDHLIIVNKPHAMAVHPAAGNWTGTLVHALLHHCAGSLSGIGGVERPGIVHRLDKDTSGLLVAAKDDQTHNGLAEQFAEHSVERAYIAFTRSSPEPREGRIKTRIARSDQDRKKMAVVNDPHSLAGKLAITNYKTLATYGREGGAMLGRSLASKVECRLETGRTHQIRVHMAHIAAPLLGDPTYGRGRAQKLKELDDGRAFKDFRRQALHAYELGFKHPITGEALHFTSDLPTDMQRLEKFLETL
ncbi:RluA family pseudouridine synthase [Hyphobacterium sp.]|uniref:RluA family pseudouridine synthase n=1 Tax=Hyphobacterium sp. TaxID=2004662 RepID=UPI003BAA7E13